MSRPYAIVFAGVPGSSKSIIAHYLSCEFNLPIFNNDVIRAEVKEDFLADNINIPHVLAEYNKRVVDRHEHVLDLQRPVILDASVDRLWDTQTRQQLIDHGYDWYLISLDWSYGFMANLYARTDRPKAINQLPGYQKQHESFLADCGQDINLHLEDRDFPKRNILAAEGLQSFIGQRLLVF